MKPTDKFTFLAGARYDNVNIEGVYDFDVDSYEDDKNLSVFVPRVTAMYDISDNLKARELLILKVIERIKHLMKICILKP
ncbi:TonB-dependent receptor [Lutibacter sp. A80]|nr:TonB-dependent receptor [Lutibacter sp. A80]